MIGRTLAIMATTAFLAFPALAAETPSAPAVSDAAKQAGIGIDVTAAGTTTESRLAFYNSLSVSDRTMVNAYCKDDNESNPRNRTAEETAFCQAVIK